MTMRVSDGDPGSSVRSSAPLGGGVGVAVADGATVFVAAMLGAACSLGPLSGARGPAVPGEQATSTLAALAARNDRRVMPGMR
jgi:hypothetical protein